MQELARISETYVSVHPNAGLPNAFGGYDLEADEMADHIREWAESGFLNMVGGCCGTTPGLYSCDGELVGAGAFKSSNRSTAVAVKRRAEDGIICK